MQTTHTSIFLFVLAHLFTACSSSSPSGPKDLTRKSEIDLRFPPGLEQTVRVDSIHWDLGLYDFTVPDQVEIDGRFYIAFHNLSNRNLQLRYELHFFDEDTFLVDLFRPLEQPLHLAAGQTLEASEAFFLRIPDPLDLRFIATMRLVANIAEPP